MTFQDQLATRRQAYRKTRAYLPPVELCPKCGSSSRWIDSYQQHLHCEECYPIPHERMLQRIATVCLDTETGGLIWFDDLPEETRNRLRPPVDWYDFDALDSFYAIEEARLWNKGVQDKAAAKRAQMSRRRAVSGKKVDRGWY